MYLKVKFHKENTYKFLKGILNKILIDLIYFNITLKIHVKLNLQMKLQKSLKNMSVHVLTFSQFK